MTVERILIEKGSHVSTVEPEALIADIVAALEADDVGAVIVSGDGQHIEGIISERDVVRGLLRFGLEVLGHPARDMMTADVVTCTADDPVAGVMALMDARKMLAAFFLVTTHAFGFLGHDVTRDMRVKGGHFNMATGAGVLAMHRRTISNRSDDIIVALQADFGSYGHSAFCLSWHARQKQGYG